MPRGDFTSAWGATVKWRQPSQKRVRPSKRRRMKSRSGNGSGASARPRSGRERSARDELRLEWNAVLARRDAVAEQLAEAGFEVGQVVSTLPPKPSRTPGRSVSPGSSGASIVSGPSTSRRSPNLKPSPSASDTSTPSMPTSPTRSRPCRTRSARSTARPAPASRTRSNGWAWARGNLSAALWRRQCLSRAHRGRSARYRGHRHGPAARQAQYEHSSPVRGREGARGYRARVRHIRSQSGSVLSARRGGRAPRRCECGPVRRSRAGAFRARAGHARYPQQVEYGSHGPTHRRHHERTRRVAAGIGGRGRGARDGAD